LGRSSFNLRIVLFGSSGQIGFELAKAMASLGEVIALKKNDANFNDPESLRDRIQNYQPDIIINAAAYTAVDSAENDYETAQNINTIAPEILAEEAEVQGSLLVHYSTDYVFDGQKRGYYKESDRPNPLSAYGRSKLNGELAVSNGCRRHLIFRTSWVFGKHGHNFLKNILHKATENLSLRVVADQTGAPTSSLLISDVTTEILKKICHFPPEDHCWGLYHLAASGETNWYDYSKYIITHARALGYPLKAIPKSVEPIKTNEITLPAARPANSLLETKKLRETFSIYLPDWKLGVNRVLEEIIESK